MPMFADSVRGLAAAMIVAAILVAALVAGREVFVPFAMATILAFVLAPLVRGLSERRVPHGASVAIVLVAIVGLSLGASALFSNQLLTLTASLAGYKDNLTQKVRVFTGSRGDGVIRKAADSIDVLGKAIAKEAQTDQRQGDEAPVVVARETKPGAASLVDQIKSIVGPLAGVGLTLLFTGFLLAQHLDIRDRVVRLAGVDNMTATTSALSEAGSRLSRLFLLQAAINCGFGVVVGIALAVIGVPNAVLWAIATAALRFVPFIGSFLAALPPVLLAAAVDPGWSMVAATLALFLIGEPIVGHVVEPYVLGRGVGLSAFAMVLAASFWTLVWGPIGLLLAAPLTMALVVLGQYIPRLEFLSVLLGDAPALKPHEEFYHRLLSGDAAAGSELIEQSTDQSSIAEVCDRIVLPALRVAVRDQRMERLDERQTETIKSTLDDVVEIIADGLPPRANEMGATPEYLDDVIIVVPARGSVDTTAAQFVASIIDRTTQHRCVAVERATGLLGISAAKMIADGGTARSIVISTVGGIDHHHLRLLARRARKDFPDARILVCDWGVADDQEPQGGAMSMSRLVSVIEHLGYAQGRPIIADPVQAEASSTAPFRTSRIQPTAA